MNSAFALSSWKLIRGARLAAGLTQRELAARAGTSQPAVARYESARTAPDLGTLARLLHACGYRLEMRAVPLDQDELRQLDESLRKTPRERAERNRRVTDLAARAARARRQGRVHPLVPR